MIVNAYGCQHDAFACYFIKKNPFLTEPKAKNTLIIII